MRVEFGAVARNDSGGFLAAMLQRVKAKIDELRRFGVAEDAHDTAVVVEVVVESV
jgi:hypothetical protein